MFKNYQVKEYLGYDQKSDTYRYRILIIDDDFLEEVEVAVGAAASRAAADCGAALIQIYSVRQLNVPLNLFLLCRQVEQYNSWYNIETQLQDYQKCVKEFAPYYEEIMQIYNRYNKQKVFW